MRLTGELNAADLPNIIRKNASLLHWQSWQDRIDQLREIARKNPYAKQFIWEQHGIELGFDSIRKRYRATHSYSKLPRTLDEYQFCAFLACFDQIYPSLSPNGQRRLLGMIRSALNQDNGFLPLSFELETAAHFGRKGFDTVFHDLENGGGFDLLLSRGDLRVEVECKHLSADVGMQIHNRDMCNLGATLPTILDAVPADRTTIFEIALPGRLNPSDFEQIAEAILESANGNRNVQTETCTVRTKQFPLNVMLLTAIENDRADDLRTLAKENFGLDVQHALLRASKNRIAIVTIRSEKTNTVLERIFRNAIVDSKKQFSRAFPGLLMIKLPQISDEGMKDLQKAEKEAATGIQQVSSAILNRRKYLCGIALLPSGEVRQFWNPERDLGTSSVRRRRDALIYWNTRCEFANMRAMQAEFFGQ